MANLRIDPTDETRVLSFRLPARYCQALETNAKQRGLKLADYLREISRKEVERTKGDPKR